MRIWYPKGQQPAVKVETAKDAMSFYGALNVATGKETVLEAPWQNSEITVQYLEMLEREYAGYHVLMLWDGAPWHRGAVREYLKRKNKKWKLELMYFPAYSPDMNPQETVWKNARIHCTHNSEDNFETKIKKFGSFLVSNTFTTNFLEKYS